MKKFFLGLMAYGLVFQVQLLAQTGLQTDTDGSITGTAGTEYLWVNAENFPDDSFRFYLQQQVASTATGGGKYVVPANVTNIDLNTRCCSYSVGQVIKRTSQRITRSQLPADIKDSIIEWLDGEGIAELREDMEASGYCDDYYDTDYEEIYKSSWTFISSVRESNGIHYIQTKDTVSYVATLMRVAMEGNDILDGCAGVSKYASGGGTNETLYVSHNYYRSSGNVSDLTGINYFTSLQSLNCSNSQLTSLNLTSSLSELRCLSCARNQLTSLDLTALPKLDSLDCSNNRLTDLKVNLVAHPWWNSYPSWSASDLSLIGANQAYKAHQRVYLNCSNNYLTNLNNVSVTPTAVGQLVNIDGSYSNNRILAFPQGTHPYYDLQQGIFAYGGIGNDGYWGAYDPYNSFVLTYMFPKISQINATQKALFEGLGFDPGKLPFKYQSNMPQNTYIALYLHPYGLNSYEGEYWRFSDYLGYEKYAPNLSGFYSSQQNIGINLSVIDKSRSRVGISVPDNLRDEENSFETVLLLNNSYPEKVKQGSETYYAYNESGSTGDLDYCHVSEPFSYSLFNGYITWTGSNELGLPGLKWLNGYYDGHYGDYDLSTLDINKYGDWFDPNINTYYNYYIDILNWGADIFYIGGHDSYSQRCDVQPHSVTLTADHYVMYVNPISEDTEGKCNGTAVFDYDAIIPEGMEAFIVTGYTNGGEADRFKTGQLQLVKVGDGDGADGYKRVIPANNPVCLRTKQTVSEGQAANNMSTTGLYPFHNNNQRTNYPCEDPNDEQFEPLELIPSSLFEGNKLRGVLDTSGQSYTAGTVLTLGRYKGNNEHKIGFWTYNGTKLNMHRVYILKSDLNMPSEAKGCTLDFGYENSTTAIDGVGLGDVEHSGDTWYTLQGIRLAEKPSQKGVYIHNGKKVVVMSSDTVVSSTHASTEDIYTDNF